MGLFQLVQSNKSFFRRCLVTLGRLALYALKMRKRTIIKFKANIKDRGEYALVHGGEPVFEYTQGYVPDFFQNLDADVIYIDVDAETGKIINWPNLPMNEIIKQFRDMTGNWDNIHDFEK